MDSLLGMPAQASEHAAAVDNTMGLVHLLMLLLLVGWSLYFVYVLFRFSRKRNPKADPQGTRTHASSYVEAGVAIFEAVLLLGFSIPLWADRVGEFPDESEAVTIRVVSQQFVWNVHYAGTDGVFGRTSGDLIDAQSNPIGLDSDDPNAADDVVSVNLLHVPVNTPIVVRLSSMDVIHSFSLNEMRVKQDAVPGIEIPLWFVPMLTTEQMRKQSGNPDFNYEIACAQLCGIGHATMRGLMIVETQQEFDAWLAQKVQEKSQFADPFFN